MFNDLEKMIESTDRFISEITCRGRIISGNILVEFPGRMYSGVQYTEIAEKNIRSVPKMVVQRVTSQFMHFVPLYPGTQTGAA